MLVKGHQLVDWLVLAVGMMPAAVLPPVDSWLLVCRSAGHSLLLSVKDCDLLRLLTAAA